MKSLVRLLQADLDVEQAPDHYGVEAPRIGLSFLDALEKAYLHVQHSPGSGSLRYAHALDIPGLGFWPCQRFPHMVFYVESDEHIALVRILHGGRDIPATFQDLMD